MTDELSVEFASLLQNPINQIEPSFASTVRDCEEPHSDRKRECTEIRCRMMKKLIDLGYGKYSLMNIVGAMPGSDQEPNNALPESVSTHASAATQAAFIAILTRYELLRPEEGSRGFDRQLNLVLSQVDAVLSDPKSTYNVDWTGDGLAEAVRKLSGKQRSVDALQFSAKNRREAEAPLIEERNKHIRQLGAAVASEPGHYTRIAGKVTTRYNESDYKNFPPYRRLTSKTIRPIFLLPEQD